MIFSLIRPILLKFVTSDQVKRLVVEILRKLAHTSDNTVDDRAVDLIELGLFGKTS